MHDYISIKSDHLEIVSSKPSDASALAKIIESMGIRTHVTDSLILPKSKVLLYKYKKIIDQKIISQIGSSNIINLHNGKLPEYRGLHALSWMIQNGESIGVLTLHEVEPTIDTGAIISEFKFDIGKQMDINDAQKIVAEALKIWLPNEVIRWFHNEKTAKRNPRKLYRIYPEKNDNNFFDKKWKIREAINLIRAVNPPYGPGAIYQDKYQDTRVVVAFSQESTEYIEKNSTGTIKCNLSDGVLEFNILPM
jgi:methionyl-tRNA formyltransferase